MSIALERSNTDTVGAKSGYNHRIGRSGFGGSEMTCTSIYGDGEGAISPEFGGGDRSEVVDEPSSSSSSIGKNSDDDDASPDRRSDGGGDGDEVQSAYKGGPLDNLEALEEILPMKRSISQFYIGKSKSFTSLGDAVSCSSIKDIVKPENAYTRKRKNLLAYHNIWDKNCNGIRRSSSSGGILKRNTNSRSTLALAATMGCAGSSNSSDNSSSNSPSPGPCLPPLPPQIRRLAGNDLSSPPLLQKFSSWRSYSLSDLQGVASTQTISDRDRD